MSNIFNIHRMDNIGDLNCSPVKYFPKLSEIKEIDICSKNLEKIINDKYVILGGGGLLGHPFFSKSIDIIKSHAKGIISWSIGHNVHDSKTISIDEDG